MSRTIVFVNGPPESGKDTIADYLVYEYGFSKHKFAQPLHAALENKLINQGYTRSLDELKRDKKNGNSKDGKDGEKIMVSLKNSPNPLTLRNWMIEVSETIVKQELFNDISSPFFGVACAFRVAADPNRAIVISDCGFKSEVSGFLNLLNRIETPPRIVLFQVFRQTCALDKGRFVGDSRSWISVPEAKKYIIPNTNGLETLYARIDDIVYDTFDLDALRGSYE